MTSIQYDEKTLLDLRHTVARHLNDAADADGRAAQARKNLRQAATTAANCRAAAAQYQALLDHAEGKPTAPAEPDPAAERANVLAGLRALADFLEDHPDVPIDELPGMAVFMRGEDRAAQVGRIAEQLGTEAGPEFAGGSSHVAIRTFGPVTYRAVATKVYNQPATEDAPAESEVSK